jgi:hypothetical protein
LGFPSLAAIRAEFTLKGCVTQPAAMPATKPAKATRRVLRRHFLNIRFILPH